MVEDVGFAVVKYYNISLSKQKSEMMNKRVSRLTGEALNQNLNNY